VWLEQMMQQAEANPARATAGSGSAPPPEEEVDEPPPTATAGAPAEPEKEKDPAEYDDVMKMIEENRKKNEAKRAAQSARNAEIIARFEERQASGGQ
jgi:hypothetical protein